MYNVTVVLKMGNSISIDDLADVIAEELESYTEEVDDLMQDEIDKLSKEVRDNLKNNPDIPEKTGEYKKSFYIKKVAQGKGYKRNRTANKKASLTHLLEDGHLTSNGKRTRAFPHWKEAQELADTLPERMKKKL